MSEKTNYLLKKIIALSILVVLSLSAYPQSKNNLSVVYGFAANSMYSGNLKYDGGYRDGNSNMLGLNYTRQINSVFALQTGLIYSINQLQYNSFASGISTDQNAGFNMLTVPFIAKISFFKYFFADGGLTADFETSNKASISDHQSGIGYQLGLGTQINFNKLSLTFAPVLQQHAVAHFSQSSYSLINGGVQFGIGYNF